MMFAQQFHDTARKRTREDEIDGSQVSCGFAEHRTKRLALPVRVSPGSQKPAPSLLPHALTPMDAEQQHQQQLQSTNSSWPASTQFTATANAEGDLEMMDSAQAPAQFNLGSDSTDRTPTPIQCSFSTAARNAGSWNGPGPAVAPGQMNGLANMGHVHSGTYQDDRSVPRTMQTDSWHNAISRRIPSPISEGEPQNGYCQSSTHAGTTAGMNDTGMMDVSSPTPSHTFPNNHPRQPANYEPYDPEECQQATAEAASAPSTPSPARNRGHIRNCHTVNNWTWQPGMKKSFSIGYRADCEKCQQKVPGHFNHIVIS